jgi:hypothetical protein
MTGDELIAYLHILSQKQAEFSKIKQKLIEELTPIENARNEKRAAIRIVDDKKAQAKLEIASVKYALKAEAENLA